MLSEILPYIIEHSQPLFLVVVAKTLQPDSKSDHVLKSLIIVANWTAIIVKKKFINPKIYMVPDPLP